jgi:hypothetical protein
MNRQKSGLYTAFLLVMMLCLWPSSCTQVTNVGVIFVVHGGFDTYSDQYVWDAGVQQFSYDPNHSVYKIVIWNSSLWNAVLKEESSVKYQRKYAFEYERIGGTDPFQGISDQQLADMETELDKNTNGINFEVDWACWMCGDHIENYPYPRFIYYGPDGPGEGENCTYCGKDEEGGSWSGCNPDRYNVDGPVERLLEKGVTKIIMVDLTVGGVRFSKTYDVVQMTKRCLNDHGSSVPVIWVNDYTNLMERSYPTEPEGWTKSFVPSEPEVDPTVSLEDGPNPIAEDSELAQLQVEGIEASVPTPTVSYADTGVILLNHAINDYNEYFDPKIDDTLTINENIKSLLFSRHPEMDPDNIIGAFMGIKELNPDNELVERNRDMRGEDLGNAWLYESLKEMPGDEWGYRYWDALEYLKNRGVKYMVIGFPQIVTDSVLNLVEIHNQIGKEIGIKNWIHYGSWDYDNYPGVGHPFTDYWGNWVDTECGEWDLNYDSGTSEFTMGATLTGQTSGATGVLKWFTESGNWSVGTASGTLTLKQVTGSFQDGEIITDDKSPAGSATIEGAATLMSASECCFVIGGCDDPLRPYPPPRQTPINQKRSDMDPSLAYDVSDYGHLGYGASQGTPSPDGPVQEQYTGTWTLYRPPNADLRVGQLLAKYVLKAAIDDLP